MNPAVRESEIYFSMASLSGTESEYNLPLGGDIPGTNSIVGMMRRERSGPGLTEHLLQVEILLGHVRQAPHLILQHRTRNRKPSRHKTRGIAGSTPLQDGVTTPIHPRIVLSEPGVTQNHQGQRSMGDEERDGL